MRRPSLDEIATYCERFGVTPEVAWRDFLQLRIAEAASRSRDLQALCVWKGAFVMRFVLGSARASGDLDATVGRNRDRVSAKEIRRHLAKACEDLDIVIPKESEPEPGDRSVSFAPITWTDPDIGTVTTSIDLSMREDLICPPRRCRIDAGLVPPFEIYHMDLNEQVAEKMRCLAQRKKIGDGHDVVLLWEARAQFDRATIRTIVPTKLTSGQDHKRAAREGVEARYQVWESRRGRELPHNAVGAHEMREVCLRAVDEWIV